MAKKPAVKKPRNRAAQDTTLINLRALKKRVTVLEVQLAAVVEHLTALDAQIQIEAARRVQA